MTITESDPGKGNRFPTGSLLRKVGSDGLTREQYESIKDKSVGPRMTVGDLIKDTILTGGFEWEHDDEGNPERLVLAKLDRK